MKRHLPSDDEIARILGDPGPEFEALKSAKPPAETDKQLEQFYREVENCLRNRVELARVYADYQSPKTTKEFMSDLEAFVASATPQHECFWFSTPQSDWNRLAGRAGFALVIDGRVTNVLLTICS